MAVGASRIDHRKPQGTGQYFLALSVDLSRAERDHCAAKGSRHRQSIKAEGRCLLGGWRQALVSKAPYIFRHRALVPSVLLFLPRASFGVSFCQVSPKPSKVQH